MSQSERECGFCHGRAVGNASSWLDGKPRPPAPCPRCGETNDPGTAIASQTKGHREETPAEASQMATQGRHHTSAGSPRLSHERTAE